MRRAEKNGLIVSAVWVAVAVWGWVSFNTARAVEYTWDQGNAGGDWSTTTNWSPVGEPAGGGDSATLGDVTTGTRTVVYDAGASGTVTTVTLVQTTADATNELLFNRSAGVTSAITLGTTGGTEQITVRPVDAATANVVFTTSGGITLESGGVLSLGAVNPSGGSTVYRTDLAGSVSVNGGLLEVDGIRRLGTTSASSQSQINFALSMTAGTINIANVAGTGTSDRRLLIIGNTTISGGAVTADAAGSQFVMRGSTLQFEPDSFDTADILLSLEGSTQAMATNVVFNGLLRSTGTKTITSTLAGQNLGFMQISDGNSSTPGSRTTFKLGSDLTLASGSNLPAASSLQTLESGRIDLGVDADTFTLDLSANASVWTPTKSTVGGVTSAVWDLAGNGGTIAANGFNFTSTGVTVNVGAGLTLESKAGNGVANNLGGGTIEATSTFLYSGAATAGSPSTLTSTATIGNVAVSAGALQLGSLGGIAGSATVSGGSLDLGGTTRTFTNVTLAGGEITAGTLATTGAYSLEAGTISAVVSGSQGVTKTTAGTVTLAGANTFTGVAAVTAGTLALGDDAGLGGDTPQGTQKLSMGNGTLDLAGFSPTVFGVAGGSGTITSASGGTLTIKVNNGATGATLAGDMNLATSAASGRTYQVLSGNNTYSGTTSIAASTLLAILSETGLGATSGATTVSGTLELKGPAATDFSVAEPLAVSGGTLRTNAQSGTAGTTTLSGAVSLLSGTATFEVNNNAPLLRLTGSVGGSGDLVKTAVGTLEIASTSNYSGSTTLSAGSLVVNGALTGTSGVAVGTGTRLAGSGTIAAAVSGAGLVSPGNSPGILTASQVDPTGGLDYAFEFTATGSPDYAAPAASVNDVLRLTDGTTPFATSLSAGNVIDVYFDVATLAAGDTFKGGFFTDLAGDFTGSIANATYAYWVKGNGSGTDSTFNGQGYYSLGSFDASLSVTLSTVAEAADFGSGTINGEVTQFVVVPEPASLEFGGLVAAAALSLLARRQARRA